MSESPIVAAHRLLTRAVGELAAAARGAIGDAEVLSVLRASEEAARQLELLSVRAVADLERRGTFAQLGYRSTAKALTDMLGWEWADARRRLLVAENACERVGLNGAALPARLPATAKAYADGECSGRQVEVIARLLASDAAGRLSPPTWAVAEEQLAAMARKFGPADLARIGAELVETLDQDGPEPDDRPPAQVNELFLTRNPNGAGGKIKGRIDDAAMFDAIVTVVDARSKPLDADDDRPLGQRQAEALADSCGYVLDHGELPDCGGERPHLNVIVRLEDLENRARAACLDFGGNLTPESLRMLCCDARVVPIVMNGAGQPLDVGRASRTIPDGLRRAVAARDQGCAKCGKHRSWCEIHHVRPWIPDGETRLDNLASLCRACHRLVHHAGWDVRMRDGLPEFLPPRWIDPQRRPRRRPPPLLAAS